MDRKAITSLLMVCLGLVMSGQVAYGAETPEDFFRGKTLTWIMAAEQGSGTDLVARIIAPFLAKEIGAKVKVEGRGTDEGINYVYNKGTRDGLTLGLKTATAIIGNDVLKAPGVQYETDKFNFVADVSRSVKVFQISPKLPYRTLDALRKAKGLRGGGTSSKGAIALSSAVMFEILGLDGKIITGYEGTKNLVLAMARGEVDFRTISENTAKRDEKDGYVINLMILGDKKSVAVPHVPLLSELGVKVSKEMEAVYRFVAFEGQAVVLPPGVPQERVEYLRKAFQSLSHNKELQKLLEKLIGDVRPFVPGKELQEEMVEIKSDKAMATKLDAVFKKYTAVR